MEIKTCGGNQKKMPYRQRVSDNKEKTPEMSVAAEVLSLRTVTNADAQGR